jgi:hypothetical protein
MKKLPHLLQKYPTSKKLFFGVGGGMFWLKKYSKIFYNKLHGGT